MRESQAALSQLSQVREASVGRSDHSIRQRAQQLTFGHVRLTLDERKGKEGEKSLNDAQQSYDQPEACGGRAANVGAQ